MPVRTTRLDVLALVRSTPVQRGRTGGGGSFGLGLAPAPTSPFTGFDFTANEEDGLTEGTEAYNYVGRFQAQPYDADTTYELVDDLGGTISTSPDGGAPFEFDNGYLLLFTTNNPLVAGPQAFTMRATLNGVSEVFTVEIDVAAMQPYSYAFTITNDQFVDTTPTGGSVADFFPEDNRLQITSVVLTDNAGDRFAVVNNINIVRGATAIVAGTPYDLVADITFSDGHVEEGYAFTLEAFNIG